jgi:F-type H+-transporting ATPase subunit delta
LPIPVARRYAQALLAALRSDDALERAERDLLAVSRLLSSVPSFGRILAHPGVKPERKKALLDVAFSGTDPLPQTRRLIWLLVEAREIRALPEIASRFRKLKDLRMGVTSVEVTTPVPVSAGDRAAWEAALAKRAGTGVRVEYRTDPSLIGGATATVGSVLFDGSVRGSLERIRQTLLGG